MLTVAQVFAPVDDSQEVATLSDILFPDDILLKVDL